jgi:hypothetical protein
MELVAVMEAILYSSNTYFEVRGGGLYDFRWRFFTESVSEVMF